MPHAAMVRPMIPPQTGGLGADALAAIAADVWERLLDARLRPAARWSPVDVAVSASVPLDGPAPAVGVLSVPTSVATSVTGSRLGLQDDELAPGDIDDALGEIVVAIGAGLRAMLADVTRLGPPSVVHGAGLSTVVPGARLTSEARLRSAAGPVQVSLWHLRAARVG